MEKQNYGDHEGGEAYVDSLIACASCIFKSVFDASIQLDLFQIIDKSGGGDHVSASEIASHLQTRNFGRAAIMLDAMLGVLVSHSFLTCSIIENGTTTELRYGLSPKGKFFVPDEEGASLEPFYALIAMKESTNWCITLKDAVLEGRNLFESSRHHFEELAYNPDHNKIFNSAMGSLSTLSMKEVLSVYNGFERVNTLVDVGGGNGSTLDMIISKYTWISGINLDLPDAIRTAPTYKGVKHVTGDMFVGVPKGDAIILKSVLHNWNDEQCARVLNNCYEALPKKGKVILMESILPEIPQTDVYSKQVTLMNIMMMSIDGKERTRGEYEAMAKEAGFAGFNVACRAYDVVVMELVKF